MAGLAGFEPTHARIKTWCLTAWRQPNLYSPTSFKVAALAKHVCMLGRITPGFLPYALRAISKRRWCSKLLPAILSNLRMPGSKPGALPLGDSPIYIVQPLSKLPLLLNTYACSAGLLRASCPTPFGPSAKDADAQNCSRQFCRTYACQDQNMGLTQLVPSCATAQFFNSKLTFEILHNDTAATGLNLLQQS